MDRHKKPSDQFTQKPRDLNAELLADIRREQEKRSTPNFEEDPLDTIEREDRLKRAGRWPLPEEPFAVTEREERERCRSRDVDVRIDRPDPEQYVRREILLTAEKMFARELERSQSDAAFCRCVALIASGACIVLAIVSIILWFSARS